jgi:hypothetical protein
MLKTWRLGLGAVVFWVVLLGVGGAWAAQTGARQTAGTVAAGTVAPVPPTLLAGKKIFISNAGADSGLFPHPFSGTPDRGYSEFYSAIQGWGRYEIVAAPSEADLVLQLQLMAPNGPVSANKEKGASDPLPMFRLVIYEAKSHYVLWALTESIGEAYVQKTHDRNFDDAVAALVGDLKELVSRAGVAGR